MANEYNVDDVARALADSQTAATANAAGSVEENPDESARAIKLSQATGVHPLAIVGDDTFEPRAKAQMAAQIVGNNDALQRYINAHPLAARISNDDWGGLDKASQSINAVGDRSIFGRFIDEFKEGFGDPQLGQWMYEHEPTRKMLEKYPGLALWVAGVGGLVELPAKIFTGTLHGAHGAIEQGLMDAGMESSSARKLAKDLTGMLEYKFMKPEAPSPGPSAVKRTYAPLKAEIKKLAKDNEAARPFLEAQEEPPYGLSPDVDGLKEDQLKLDEKAIDAAVKDFQATATFARSPEMASIFAGVHPETKLEVSAQAIRKLYGDKEPAPGDNLFGDIPGFIEKLHSAEQLNGGVEISLKDWLHLDPEVIKELKEDIRHREGGVSHSEVEEAKEAKALEPKEEEGIEAFHGSPHEFDAFKSEAIGTGEGAQSYGHGLYFAEEPEVAESYAVARGTQAFSDEAFADPSFEKKYRDVENDWQQAEAEYQEAVRQGDSAKISDAAAKANNAAEALNRAEDFFSKKYPIKDASTYKVHIRAKKEEFLDWDKEFEEQHPKVQEALRKILEPYKVELGTIDQDPFSKGQHYYEEIAARLGGEQPDRAWTSSVSKEKASRALQEAGIPGIKYLDQGSRLPFDPGAHISHYITSGKWKIEEPYASKYNLKQEFDTDTEAEAALRKAAGETGTYNLVVFDPSLITILSRNGQALASVEKAAGLESKVMKEMGREEAKPEEAPAKEGEPLTEPIFGKGALGLPQTQVKLLQKLTDQKNSENMERELKRAVKAEARKQTAEWKDNRKSMAAEVEEEFYRKPEVAATQWLFDNKLGKAKTGKHTLDETKVTPEQRAALPDRMFAKSGKKLSPDELASQVGSLTGKELLEDLTSLHDAIGDTPWRQAFREAISAETDNRMQRKYGDLASNILEEAKDHALGITQMDLLHEDTVAMGMLAEAEMPYTKAEVRAWIKGFAGDQLLGSLKADKFLQDSGRLGKLIEIALAKKKFAEAFKAAQTREYNALMAKEAKRIEKERDWYEDRAKQFRRAPAIGDSVSGEAWDMIQALLIKTGFPVDRSVQQIQESMLGNKHESLRDFVQARQKDGLVAAFPEWIYDSEPKAIENLTYEQFAQVNKALRNFIAYGRREKKIFIGEREIDRVNALGELIGKLEEREQKPYSESVPKGFAEAKAKAKELNLSLVQTEFAIDMFDGGDKWGPHTQYMVRDVIDSFNNASGKWRKYGKMFDELSTRLGIKNTDWHERIPNTLIVNPDDGTPLKITRSELRTILLNFGNPENFKKFHEGWKVDPLALKAWIKDHSTEVDWKWAQGVGKIFEQAGRESQHMWKRLYDYTWDFIDRPNVQTPFGEMEGWYVPLIKHQYFEKEYNTANKVHADEGFFSDYRDRVTTPDGHTKERTRAVYPLNLDVRAFPGRLRTMIYDTEMREAIVNFRSFSQDTEWRSAVRSRHGKAYLDMMDAYIKDVANYPIDNAAMLAGVNSIMATQLRHIVTGLIGFNIGTVLKHFFTAGGLSMRTVGAQEFASAYRQVWLSPASKEIRGIIWDKFEEIQRRSRNYQESLFGQYLESTLGEGKIAKGQRKFQEYGAAAVSFSDRLSSEPTAWAEYLKARNEGRSEGDAVFAANRAVRFAHGSTAITSRPAAMRGGPMGKVFTILYSFFNDMFNRSYKMAWEARDTVKDANDLFKAGEAKEGWTTASKGGRRFLGDLVVLGLFVGMVEELVSPISSGKEDPDEGLGSIVTKGTIHGFASQVPILREVVGGLLRGRIGEAGALGAAYRAGSDLYKDLAKAGERDLDDHLLHLGDYAQHTTTALGMATGIGSRPVGNAMKYWINVGQGLEETPEGPWGAAVGTRYGTSKKHSRTLDEYTSHWLEKAGMQ